MIRPATLPAVRGLPGWTRALLASLSSWSVLLATAGCSPGTMPAPDPTTTASSAAEDMPTTRGTTINDPAHPYTETTCGRTWAPGRQVPATLALVNSPSPPPIAPPRSDYPTLRSGPGHKWAFRFGDCLIGAIVTITPRDAFNVNTVFYASDGGVAFMTLSMAPDLSPDDRHFVLRAWSSTTRAYLGEFETTW